MKSYRYISDTKLDMLAAQIPRGLRDKLAAELSINVQVFSLTLKEKPTDETRYSKLDAVVRYIEKHELVGTLDQPHAFFKGSLPLYWGPIGDQEQNIIYFGANLPHRSFGLIGSRHHTIGSAGQPADLSPTVYPMILRSVDVEGLPPEKGSRSLEEEYQAFGSIMDYINENLARGRLPENLEFLAQRLLQWPNESAGGESDHQTPFLLGSPIYVAGADT